MKQILLFLVFIVLFISCSNENEQNNTPQIINNVKKEETTKKSIIYKNKADAKILDIIEYYESINFKKWYPDQIYEIRKENEDIDVYVNDEIEPVKIVVSNKTIDLENQFEIYIENTDLTFVIEKEYEKNDSDLVESHFYFSNNELLKKVVNQDYDTDYSKDIIIKEEKRIKSMVTKYTDEVLIHILETYNNFN